jgi:hypothetical protein
MNWLDDLNWEDTRKLVSGKVTTRLREFLKALQKLIAACRRTVRKAYGFPSRFSPSLSCGSASARDKNLSRKGSAFPHCAAAEPLLLSG